MTDIQTKRWYVLKVEGGYEIKVAVDLSEHEHRYESYLARAFTREVVGKSAFAIPRPKWSPYVFVAVDTARGQSCREVLEIMHVIDFVSLTPRMDDGHYTLNPTTVPESMIMGLRLDEYGDWHEAQKPPSRQRKCCYAPGDLVRVVAQGHVFGGYQGIVKDARPGSVNVELGDSKFPVRLDEEDIMLVTAFQARTAGAVGEARVA